VDNQQKPKKSPLGPLERFRNLCDALSEDILREPGPWGRADEALAFKMELAHLARPEETPDVHIARLRRELQQLGRHHIQKVNFEQAARDHTQEVLQYLRKIQEVQKAAGLPVTHPMSEWRRNSKKRQALSGERVASEDQKKLTKQQKKNPRS
jgi:hypothetical protein